jgi:hypothetical protein
MSSRTARVIGVLALVLVVAAPRARAGEGITAKVAFDKLKTLVGDWKAESTGHGEDHSGTISYKVTGAGSVVMETEFAGSPHEMVTMYHLDGDDLVLTHYCAAGNQPKLKLDRANSTADNLVFKFAGGTNLDPAKDLHIHDVQFKFTADPKKFETQWEAFKDGKKAMGTTTMKLTRS